MEATHCLGCRLVLVITQFPEILNIDVLLRTHSPILSVASLLLNWLELHRDRTVPWNLFLSLPHLTHSKSYSFMISILTFPLLFVFLPCLPLRAPTIDQSSSHCWDQVLDRQLSLVATVYFGDVQPQWNPELLSNFCPYVWLDCFWNKCPKLLLPQYPVSGLLVFSDDQVFYFIRFFKGKSSSYQAFVKPFFHAFFLFVLNLTL